MDICLFGAASRKIDKRFTDECYNLGCKIAENGHTLIFGGGDTGIMGAVSRGVHDNGGKSLGIAPEWIDKIEKLSTKCSEFIYVDSIDERKNLFLEKSDTFIIAPGGIGTLDELFDVLSLKKLKKHSKEIIIFNLNGYYNKMIDMLNEMNEKKFLNTEIELFKIANTLDEVLDIINNNIN